MKKYRMTKQSGRPRAADTPSPRPLHKKKGKRRVQRMLATLAAGIVAVGLLTSTASAAVGAVPTPSPISTSPKDVKDKVAKKYRSIGVYYKGKRLAVDGRLIDSVTYVPVRAFFETLYPEAAVGYDAVSRTATVKGTGLSVSITDGGRVLYANGRAFYADAPAVILDDGSMYAPVRSLAKTLSVSVGWDSASYSVWFEGEPRPLADASSVYNETDLYWLSRIISAEARGESFLGQVAVGNVVLNRVASAAFPSTVKGVVFDKQGGYVQFSPVADGSIYREPTSVAVTAAKVCLEGYTVSERALYFYAPRTAVHSWIALNRPYLFTIGGHRFHG